MSDNAFVCQIGGRESLFFSGGSSLRVFTVYKLSFMLGVSTLASTIATLLKKTEKEKTLESSVEP